MTYVTPAAPIPNPLTALPVPFILSFDPPILIAITLNTTHPVMSHPGVTFKCPSCNIQYDHKKYCDSCGEMQYYFCPSSGQSGLYTNYYRHTLTCSSCSQYSHLVPTYQAHAQLLTAARKWTSLDDCRCHMHHLAVNFFQSFCMLG